MSVRLVIFLFLISALYSCASAVLTYTPTETADGGHGYHLYTVYGGLDGTREQAADVLNREGTRLCGGANVIIKEEEHERLTRWGTKNGQIDYLRQIECQ